GFITRNGSTEGRVPKTKNCLCSFNDTHANEITGSEIDSFLADIESNLKGIPRTYITAAAGYCSKLLRYYPPSLV
ncbi:hypothetical protein, partial [Butyrivibrio fibrisolvens]